MTATLVRARGRPMSRRALLAGTAGLAAITGCRGLTRRSSAATGRDIDFFWYVEGKRAKYTQAIARAYEKANPGTTIKERYTGFASYWDKLATQVAGGRTPDVFQLDITRLAEYAERGAVRPLTGLVPDPLPLDRLAAAVRPSCEYRGELHFIPTGLSTVPAVLYNRTALRELGVPEPDREWGQEEFEGFCRSVGERSGGKVRGSSDFGGDVNALESYLRSRGTGIFGADGSLTLTEDHLTEWWEMWDRLRRDGLCTPMTVTAEGGGFENSPLIKKKSVISGAYSAKGIAGFAALTTDELAFVPFPRERRGGRIGTMVTPVEWWAVSADAPEAKARAAAAFCAYALGDAVAARGMVVEHGIPVFESLRAATKASADELVRLTIEEYERSAGEDPAPRHIYPVGAGELFDQVFGKQNQDVGFGRATVATAVTRFFDEADRTLR
ncbi:carbohydrate ABC transporter substrate-binding protein [Nonomuraea sp. K274]|uniref:Carbohydrate ABC transporter substrate-binding protein n=1 Tax=Nonomuraea cypriaca TaxID=1187855 RepID=A0A931F0B2_9ACTN|nr:ABC transporter substrate-binding protein [Nonomuraea cypriaca]MBF8186143.1 carbohydrate ABC transporter substrate-binding protein [Nonomuraea cypriaca]